MPDRWRPEINARFGTLLAWVVFALGTCLAAALAMWVQHEHDADAQAEFQLSVERVSTDLVRRLRQPFYGLKGARSLYAARAAVTRRDFGAYVDARDLPNEFRGVRGFGFVQHVMRSEVGAFVAAERADGAPAFAIRQLNDRSHDDLWVIKFIEPAANNEGVAGLDLGSEPLRREALQRAVDSGEPTLSSAIVLVQDRRKTPGVLYFLPVYAHGADPTNATERRAALVGLLYAPVVIAELLDGSSEAAAGRISFELFDAAVGGATGGRLYAAGAPHDSASPGSAAAGGRHAAGQVLSTSGRELMLRVRSTPAFDASFASPLPWLVFAGGVLASALLALLLWQQASGRRRAELLAQHMTADLDRMAKVVRHTSNAVTITDADLRITWVNEGFTRITGYVADEALGRTPAALVGSGKADAGTLKTLVDAAAAGRGCRVEILNRAKDGREYWIDTEVQPLHDAQGRLTGFMEIGSDVTDRHLAQDRLEAALRASDALLSTVNRHAIVSVTDRSGRITEVNDAFCRVSGWQRDELLGQNHRAVNSGVHDPAFWAEMWRSIAAGTPWRGEICNRARDGSLYWVDTIIAPFADADGRIDKYVSIRIDISDAKRIEAELRAAQAQLHQHNALMTSVLESLPCGLSVFDTDLQLVTANSNFRRLLDLPDALFGAPPTRYEDLVRFNAERGEYGSGDVEAMVRTMTAHAQPPVVVHQFERMRPNGTWLEVRGAPMPGGGLITTYTDVSARHAAEAEVRRSAELLRGAIETIDEAFVLFDPDDRLVFCNDKYRRVYAGVAELIVPGARFEDIVRAGAERGHYVAAVGRVDAWIAERVAAHRSGEQTLTQQLDDGRSLRIVERRMPDGHTAGFRIDITELVRATEAAQDASRAKGQFLANMSHEIRTPMNAILGMLTLLGRTELSARQADYVDKTRGAAQALLELLNDILDFSKVEAGRLALDPHPFRVDQLLSEVSDIAAGSVGAKPLEVRFDVDPELPRQLVGDAMRLKQVLINLTGNAIKFTPAGEVVVSMLLLAREADQVTLEVAVRDTGIGIAPENRARIFSGFTQAEASTTRRFGGTGLGLAISQRLVALMGGELDMNSAPGQGSRFHFRITLPLPEAGAADTAHETSPRTDGRVLAGRRLAGLRLLVVEDNANNRQVARELLEDEGALVQLANDGQEAVAAVAQAQPGFDAVLMDLQMPVMDGYSATREIRQRLALTALPIVAMTANAMASDREACLAAGMNDHVGKPFDLDHLVQVLRQHTGRAAAGRQRLHGAAHLPPAVNDAARVAGVDLGAALRRLGGKLEIYQRVLTRFIDELEAMPALLQAQLAAGERQGATQLLHTLKGLAATLGATALAQEAARGEKRLRSGRGAGGSLPAAERLLAGLSAAITAARPGLTQLSNALSSADAALAAEEASARTPSDDAAAVQNERSAALDALQTLGAQLGDADMGATETMASLRRRFGTIFGEPLRRLDDAVGALEFDRAEVLCEAVIRSLTTTQPS